MAVFENSDGISSRGRSRGHSRRQASTAGLADLLATALVGPDAVPCVDLTVAIALDHWWPTEGTRKTGERNTGASTWCCRTASLVPHADCRPTERSTWSFGVPPRRAGDGGRTALQRSHHHRSPSARADACSSWLTLTSLQEIRDATTPPPEASDAQGRSAQRFEMVVEARRGDRVRTASARGQDIYAVSAPLVVEAAARLMRPGFARRGALSLGQAYDAHDFLRALAPEHLALA